MTYAEHQEAVSAALVSLLRRGEESTSPADADVVHDLRHQTVLSLLERVSHLGSSEPARQPARTDRTIDAARYPLHVLRDVLTDLAPSQPGRRPPSGLLPGPPADQATTPVHLWQAVARHLLLGNADLMYAAKQPWHDQNPAAWYVVGDTAQTVEALVVLDRSKGPAQEYVEKRLAVGDVARLASWYGTDHSPDLAFAAARTTLGVNGHPRIHLVRKVEDFALAQRALAELMHPKNLPAGVTETEGRPGLLAARTIAAGQVRLAEAFATWADRHGACELAEQFRTRIPRYTELHRSTLRLTELQRTSSPLVVAQQSEIVQQLRRHASPRISVASLHDLNAATHELTVNVGKALRREGMRRRNLLILDTDGVGLPGARPITNTRERFTVACRALAKDPEPDPATHPAYGRGRREQLAQSLNEHPAVRAPVVRRAVARVRYE